MSVVDRMVVVVMVNEFRFSSIHQINLILIDARIIIVDLGLAAVIVVVVAGANVNYQTCCRRRWQSSRGGRGGGEKFQRIWTGVRRSTHTTIDSVRVLVAGCGVIGSDAMSGRLFFQGQERTFDGCCC